MSYEQIQISLEKGYAKQSILPRLTKEVNDQQCFDTMNELLQEYLHQDHDYMYMVGDEQRVRHDLVEAHQHLRKVDARAVFVRLFCHVWSKDEELATIQELAGMCLGEFKSMTSQHRKFLAVQSLLEVFSTCPLIEVNETKGDLTYFTCVIPLTQELRDEMSVKAYVLPSVVVPKTVTHNKQTGYQTFGDSLILGGKYHIKYQNYDHINRCNSTPYMYEERLEELTDPVFSTEPKVKKNGEWETKEDIVERYMGFKQLHDSLPYRMNVMRKHSDHWFLVHAYCTRGRTYVKANEFNYQGSGYLKAMVNFHNKEVIKDEF